MRGVKTFVGVLRGLECYAGVRLMRTSPLPRLAQAMLDMSTY